jgi:hypothetical protein
MVRLLEDRAGLSPEAREELDRLLEAVSLLEGLLRWAYAQQPPAALVEVLVQDEYSHDVVLTWREVFLVFDTT